MYFIMLDILPLPKLFLPAGLLFGKGSHTFICLFFTNTVDRMTARSFVSQNLCFGIAFVLRSNCANFSFALNTGFASDPTFLKVW